LAFAFVDVFVMGKLSNEDKMHIQTRREYGFVAKVITAGYPDKTGA